MSVRGLKGCWDVHLSLTPTDKFPGTVDSLNSFKRLKCLLFSDFSILAEFEPICLTLRMNENAA